ncbi:MAG: hypothetical protein EOP06_20840, partial [Proteobacteria bacterium]
MSSLLRFCLTICLFSSVAAKSFAVSEDERRDAFYRHQRMEEQRQLEREQGLRDFLKEESDWEDQRKRDTDADKKRKKTESPHEDGAAYKADRKEKLADFEDSEKIRKQYIANKKAQQAQNSVEQKKRDDFAMEEFGLDKVRPRFDVAKRHAKGFKAGPSANSGGSNSGGSSNGGFPSMPSGNDFGEGFIPPPASNENYDPPPDSFPMPPPPMNFPAPTGEFDNGFYPPPPPM